MQLPIVAYGAKILTQPCQQIDQSYPSLQILIEDMWDTLYGAQGCGLAAPQVNHPIRLFLVDSQQTYQAMDRREQKAFFTEGDYGIKETPKRSVSQPLSYRLGVSICLPFLSPILPCISLLPSL